MLSLQVSDIKDCMYKLLSGDCFDLFYLVEADIRMGISYYLDGHINKDFYDNEDETRSGYCLWREVKPFVFQIIKGRRQPLGFKIILAFPDKTLDFFLRESGSSLQRQDLEGVYVNILFDPGNLRITTGISCRVFTTDRSLDQCVDDHVKKFLASKGIA